MRVENVQKRVRDFFSRIKRRRFYPRVARYGFCETLFFVFTEFVYISDGGVVVVRSDIRNAFFAYVFGKIRVVFIAVECEQQDLHSA